MILYCNLYLASKYKYMSRFLLYTLPFLLLFMQCKPYQETYIPKDQITYEKFRTEQKSFTSEDGTLKYIDTGEGPVIVLLHGVPTSGWLYRKMIAPLVKSGYRVIVPDMLGYGSSDSPEGYEIYDNQNHAKRLIALMDSLQVTNWNHVMHDAGGLWTWEVFQQAPGRIEKLALLNTIVYEEGFHPPVTFKPGFIAKTAMWMYSNGITTNMLLKKLFQKGLSKNTLNEPDVEGYKVPLREKKTKGMYYFFTQTCNEFPDYSTTFEEIDIPVSVIWGIHDDMLQWSPQQEKIIKSFSIPEENIHLLSEKHFIQETKSKEITKHLISFFDKEQDSIKTDSASR